jgi:hypothetical protein
MRAKRKIRLYWVYLLRRLSKQVMSLLDCANTTKPLCCLLALKLSAASPLTSAATQGLGQCKGLHMQKDNNSWHLHSSCCAFDGLACWSSDQDILASLATVRHLRQYIIIPMSSTDRHSKLPEAFESPRWQTHNCYIQLQVIHGMTYCTRTFRQDSACTFPGLKFRCCGAVAISSSR